MAEINFRIILRVMGILLCFMSFFMIFPIIISLLYGGRDLMSFLLSMGITFSIGFILMTVFKKHSRSMGKREGYLIVSTSWIVFSLFGMLPFLLSGSIPLVHDAFFETMSGFTTTGATILNNIDSLPHGILFWRSMIQWLGGMGIILFTLAVLPMLNSGGGIQLYNAEVPGVTHDKLRPRISQTAKRLWAIYLILTFFAFIFLFLGPMNAFDAICHAFTTMATGGYSTKQASIAYWHSAYTEYVIIFFMMMAATNFTLVYYAVLGNFKKIFHDEEARWLWAIAIGASLIISISLLITGQYVDIEEAWRVSLFQVVSVMSTTGYGTADFVEWGSFFCILFFILMFFGASAGSTSGGAKIIRLIVLLKNTVNEFYRNIHPNAVVPVRVNHRVVSFEIVTKILAFIFVFVIVLLASSITLSALGMTFEESLGSTLTCISNVGPGLGSTGPAATFSHIHPGSKWVLSFIMLVGRLELFTVLILFTPYFWKK